VDEFAAGLLIEILENPEAAPNPRLNPFNPVGVIENLNQSTIIRLVLLIQRPTRRRGRRSQRTGPQPALCPRWRRVSQRERHAVRPRPSLPAPRQRQQGKKAQDPRLPQPRLGGKRQKRKEKREVVLTEKQRKLTSAATAETEETGGAGINNLCMTD